MIEILWLGGLAALPGAVVLASHSGLGVERLRDLAVACATGLVLVATAAWLVPALAAFAVVPPWATGGLWGSSLIRQNELSSILVAFAAFLWLLTVAVTPRAQLDRAGLRRTALATLVTTGSFLTVSPALLTLFWLASVLVFLAALSATEDRRARRVAAIYLGGATLLLATGVALVAWPGSRHTPRGSVGVALIAVAALIRKGIFPFHAWVPDVFERGRLGPAILLSAPQVGAYVTALLVVPDAPPVLLRIIAVLALVTAVYGAMLALVQAEPRRACGYLFISQSALVMAGMDCTSHEAVTGALVLWLSSGLAFAGLARSVLVLEARRGRLALSEHHGGYEQMPLLATSFLLMGLACTGFPGTLGFIGEEMLVAGAVDAFPVLGFSVVIAGALTGLAVLRMYFSLFCGRRDHSPHLAVRRREGLAFTAVVLLLVGFGLAPRPLVASLTSAGSGILRSRERPRVAVDGPRHRLLRVTHDASRSRNR
jgi:NADH-quinone oxidoreductase subunit M